MRGWIASSGHYGNIMLNNIKSIGVGAFKVNNTYYWVQLFSSKSATSLTWHANKNVAYNISIASSNIGPLSLTPSGTQSLEKGKTLQLKAILNNSGPKATRFSIPVKPTYSSSNTKVATVSSTGLVKAVGAGTAKITAKIGPRSASLTIKVPAPAPKKTTATITFIRNINGADNFSSTKSYTTGTSGQKLIKPAWSRTGYTLLGWNTSRSASKATYVPSYAVNDTWVKNNAPKKTYYAIWKANTYTIKFAANGGAGTMSSIQATYNTGRALPANTFTRSGYTFAGWNTKADGTGKAYSNLQLVKNLSSVSGDVVTLYAQWKEDKPAAITTTPGSGTSTSTTGANATRTTVTYHPNGGRGMIFTVTASPIGQSCSIAKCPYAYSGYTFVEWNTKADGTGKSYAQQQRITVDQPALTLYAIWKLK